MFPRPVRRPSLFEKVLAFFGFAGKKKAPARRPKASAKTRGDSPAKQRAQTKPRERKPAREPEIVEVTTPRLYVGNLSYDAAENDLLDLFKGFGEVQSTEVVSHKQTQRSKGFGFVEMLSLTDAKRAVEELHNKDFMGRKLVVCGAKSGGAR